MCEQIIAVNVLGLLKCSDGAARNKGLQNVFHRAGGSRSVSIAVVSAVKRSRSGFLGTWTSLCKAKVAKSMACLRSAEDS